MTTLATRYEITRNPEGDFPELNGHRATIISENPIDATRYEVCVWGNGYLLEQALDAAPSVVKWDEVGSVVADLAAVERSIADAEYRSWISANSTHDGSPARTLKSMAKEMVEDYVLNRIEGARGVFDITAEVVGRERQSPLNAAHNE